MDKMDLLIDRINNTEKTENYIAKSFKIRLIKTIYYSILIGILMYFVISFVLLEYNILKWILEGRFVLCLMMLMPFVVLIINTITRSVIVINRERLKDELIDLYELGSYVAVIKERFVEQNDIKMRDMYVKTRYFSFDRVVSYFLKKLE